MNALPKNIAGKKNHLIINTGTKYKTIPDYHCGSASLRSLAGMGQVRAAM
ncbi:hypothetical protein GCM10023116_19070 [Kistimonas scapharcae]|uniref:Transposase n=1 Tax=Kistimonas scapharcae TaxID=1036133 RepID=A0ABP8V139_9GAMM